MLPITSTWVPHNPPCEEKLASVGRQVRVIGGQETRPRPAILCSDHQSSVATAAYVHHLLPSISLGRQRKQSLSAVKAAVSSTGWARPTGTAL